MNFGLQIDLVGLFALLVILGALVLLRNPRHARAGVVLLGITLLGMIAAVLWASNGNNAILAIAMILIGIGGAPWFTGPQHGVLKGLALINTGTGVAIALLGMTGWFETNHAIYTWDLRLVSVAGLFIGIWTFAAGLMIWLRLSGYLPESLPTQTQKIVHLIVLIITLSMGAGAVIWPDYATVPIVLLVVLTLELGALSALSVTPPHLSRVLGRHLSLIGAAIAMLGFVQGSLFMATLGGLIGAGAIAFLRGESHFKMHMHAETLAKTPH